MPFDFGISPIKPADWSASYDIRLLSDQAQGLASSLVAVIPGWEGSGSNLREILTGVKLVGNSGTDWAVEPFGAGPRGNATNEGWKVTAPAQVKVSAWPIWLFIHFYQLGTISNNAFGFGVSYNSTQTSPFLAYSIGASSGAKIDLLANNGSTTLRQATTLTAWPTSGVHTIGGIIRASGNPTILYDGTDISIAWSGLLGSGPAYGSGPQLAFGEITASARNNNMVLGVAYIGTGDPGVGALQFLAADPFALIRPDPAKLIALYFDEVAAAGGGVTVTAQGMMMGVGF